MYTHTRTRTQPRVHTGKRESTYIIVFICLPSSASIGDSTEPMAIPSGFATEAMVFAVARSFSPNQDAASNVGQPCTCTRGSAHVHPCM